MTVTKLNGSTLATPLVAGYTYYANGDKHTETLPNGIVSTWAYDDLDRLTGLTETEGSTTLFSQTYVLNDDGTRASSHGVQRQPDGSDVTVDATWAYDADGRLTGEQQASSASGESFGNTFAYSLDNNRVKSVHVGPGVGANETVTFAYNGDDELASQVSNTAGTTTFAYDNNGDQLTSTTGGTTIAYGYDVRGKLISAGPTGTTPATYTYDDAGHLVSQTALGVTTTFIADDYNPTGYTQRLESHVVGATGVAETYLLGDRVLGQVDGNGAAFLLVDGHGSTQALTTAAGGIIESYRYDAFGTAVNFDATTAGTVELFGGDAVYDPSTGLYDHGDGVRERDGFRFVERDSFLGSTQDPLSLHRYAYANANTLANVDPSGFSAFDEGEEEELEYDDAVFEAGNGAEEDLVEDVQGEQDFEMAAIASADIEEDGGAAAAESDYSSDAFSDSEDVTDSDKTFLDEDDPIEQHHRDIQQFFGKNDGPMVGLRQSVHRALHAQIAAAIDSRMAQMGFRAIAPAAINGGFVLWQAFFANNPAAKPVVFQIITQITDDFLGF